MDNFFSSYDLFMKFKELHFRAGVGNLRPKGRMWPFKPQSAAFA